MTSFGIALIGSNGSSDGVHLSVDFSTRIEIQTVKSQTSVYNIAPFSYLARVMGANTIRFLRTCPPTVAGVSNCNMITRVVFVMIDKNERWMRIVRTNLRLFRCRRYKKKSFFQVHFYIIFYLHEHLKIDIAHRRSSISFLLSTGTLSLDILYRFDFDFVRLYSF
jgi:hypothetical protein